MLQSRGLEPLKVIYQLDYRQQLLIRASHIWIYMPFVSHTQHVLMTVIIIIVISLWTYYEWEFDGK